jgi:hypothetical protein
MDHKQQQSLNEAIQQVVLGEAAIQFAFYHQGDDDAAKEAVGDYYSKIKGVTDAKYVPDATVMVTFKDKKSVKDYFEKSGEEIDGDNISLEKGMSKKDIKDINAMNGWGVDRGRRR